VAFVCSASADLTCDPAAALEALADTGVNTPVDPLDSFAVLLGLPGAVPSLVA
jgi:hypothetical protein